MLEGIQIHSSSAKAKGARTAQDDVRDDVAYAALRQVALLHALPQAELRHLAGAARFRTVQNRGTLAAAGTEPDYLHFLIQGAGKVSRLDVNGRETLLYLVKAGETFGAAASGTPHVDDTTMVVALERSIVGHVLAKDVETMLGNTAYLSAVGQIMSQRLRQVEERLDEMTTGTVPSRTARVLLRLCNEFPRTLRCGVKVDVLLTQQDLASIVGATREIVNITLGTFRREGWLDIHNRYMCVHQRDELSEVALC